MHLSEAPLAKWLVFSHQDSDYLDKNQCLIMSDIIKLLILMHFYFYT